MANIIQDSGIVPTRFVNPTSRYAAAKVVYYSEANKLTFETYKKSVPPETDRDRYMVITKGVEYRPDLVSYDNYGTPDFWSGITEANGMKDILDFSVGTNIRLPNNVF